MTANEWAHATFTEQENKRLKAKVSALEHRLAVAEALARAAEHAREVAMAFACDPSRYPRR